MLSQDQIHQAHQVLGLNVAEIYQAHFQVVNGDDARQRLEDNFANLYNKINGIDTNDEKDKQDAKDLLQRVYANYWIANLNQEYVFIHNSLLSEEQISELDRLTVDDDNSLFSEFMSSFRRANLVIHETQSAPSADQPKVAKRYLSPYVLEQQEASQNCDENMSLTTHVRRLLTVDVMRDFAKQDAPDHSYRAVLNREAVSTIIDKGRLPKTLLPFILKLPVNAAMAFVYSLAVSVALKQHNVMGRFSIPASFPVIGFLFADIAWLEVLLNPTRNLQTFSAWWQGTASTSGRDRDTLGVYEVLANVAGSATFVLKLLANFSIFSFLFRTGPEFSTPTMLATSLGILLLSTVTGSLKMMAMESYLERTIHPLPQVQTPNRLAEALEDEQMPHHYRERLFPADVESEDIVAKKIR